MNILFVIVTMEGGGAQKLINDIAPDINKTERCELLVLSDRDDRYSKSLRNNGVKCTFIPNSVRSHVARIRFIDNFISKGDFDIVHVNLFPALYYCSILKRFKYKNLPFIYTEHNTDNRRRHQKWLRSIEKWIYNPYDCIVSISKETRTELIKWIAVKGENYSKFVVINNGVPVKEFENAKSYERRRLGLGLTDRDILLCMIGSFTEQKNHHFMMKLMKRLPENYKLILLGEGIHEYEIKKNVGNNGLSKRVFFMGFRKDVAELIKTSDIVVIPSKWEGFGLIAVEAMACGKQVVCSDVPGLSEVVGDVGIKGDIRDVEGFVEAIHKATSRLNDTAIEEKSIRRAEAFDIGIMVSKYIKLFENCLNRYKIDERNRHKVKY